MCAQWQPPVASSTNTGKNVANNIVAKAKSIVSPYFTANDFVPVFA